MKMCSKKFFISHASRTYEKYTIQKYILVKTDCTLRNMIFCTDNIVYIIIYFVYFDYVSDSLKKNFFKLP